MIDTMSCMLDVLVEGAVKEVARVYELIKTHQPLFLLHHHHPQGQHEPPAMTTQMAQSLLGEALRALNIAISVMNQQQQEIGNGTIASPHAVQLSSPSEPADSKEATSARSAKRRRPVTEGGNKNSSSWTILTRMPYGDRYEWRKYGEKRINGTHFTKSYFRCTHKDDTGCLATKYVQQKDNSDPPVFQVTYNNEHTCNYDCTATSSSPAKKITNNNPPTTGGASASNNPPTGGHHDAMMIKQEAIVVLQTPLADVSVVPFDDHQMLPYQQPFPIADHYVTMNAGDSSCLLGAFCNELDMGQIMTEPLIGEDDLELFFLCNGF